MTELTVTAKGQVTLRKELLLHLGVQPGQRIAVHKLPDGRIEMRAARSGARISEVFGVFKKRGRRSVSIEQMNDITRRGWAGRR
jgi:bifunctional DNA-binding transcriptional regulator/antitoxin component of YhaV-PrlF toxin-antitoxin module